MRGQAADHTSSLQIQCHSWYFFNKENGAPTRSDPWPSSYCAVYVNNRTGRGRTDDSRLQKAPARRFYRGCRDVLFFFHFTFIYKRKTQSSFFVKLLQYIWISHRTDSYMKSFFAKSDLCFEGNRIKKQQMKETAVILPQSAIKVIFKNSEHHEQAVF